MRGCSSGSWGWSGWCWGNRLFCCRGWSSFGGCWRRRLLCWGWSWCRQAGGRFTTDALNSRHVCMQVVVGHATCIDGCEPHHMPHSLCKLSGYRALLHSATHMRAQGCCQQLLTNASQSNQQVHHSLLTLQICTNRPLILDQSAIFLALRSRKSSSDTPRSFAICSMVSPDPHL